MISFAQKRWGRGSTPVLFLHGFTGDRTAFDHLEPLLGDSVRAIAVDLPGHGGTRLPQASGREGFLETIDSLAALLKEEGSVDVIGYSQGARVGLALAARHPGLVRRLVLESGSPGLRRRKERNERRARDESLAEAIVRGGLEAFLSGWEALPMFEGLRRLPAPLATALSERRRGQAAEGLAGALRVLGTGTQPDYWPALHRLRTPTLILTGEADTKFTAIARRMAGELPVSWRHALEGCFHAPHLEAPERYAEEVLSFLRTPWYEAPTFEADRPEPQTRSAG